MIFPLQHHTTSSCFIPYPAIRYAQLLAKYFLFCFYQKFPKCTGLIVSPPKPFYSFIFIYISVYSEVQQLTQTEPYYSKKPRLKLIQLSASNLYHVQYLWASRYRLFPAAGKAQTQFWRSCQQSFTFLQFKRRAPAGRAFTATVWRIAPRLYAGVRNPAPVSQGRLRTCHSQHCNQIGAKKLTVWTRKASVVRLSLLSYLSFLQQDNRGRAAFI